MERVQCLEITEINEGSGIQLDKRGATRSVCPHKPIMVGLNLRTHDLLFRKTDTSPNQGA
jgi:hypothetical protein